MRGYILVLGLSGLTLLAACQPAPAVQGCAAISVEDAWVREAPPGARVMAGYLRLSNRSSVTVSVIGAQSAAFGAIEFHETRHAGSSMSMQRLETLALPSGGELKLAPSGKHLMLFDPVTDMKAGQTLTIDFQCADGQRSSHAFEVRAFSIEDHSGHHQGQS